MDYEKKYKEALERATKIRRFSSDIAEIKRMEEIFPELKESEGERIRKAIIEFFELQDDNTTYSFVPKKDIIAWLEKQGKETSWKPSKEEMDALYGLAYITNKMDDKKDDAVTKLYQDLKREFFNGASYENMFPSSPVNSDINIEKQGEQKHTDKVEPKFDVRDKVYNIKNGFECTIESIDDTTYYCDTTNFDIKDQDDWELVEQKPAEWSKEDEQYLLVCKNALAKYQTTDKWDAHIIFHWLENKIKSLRPQPKQKWSQNDIDMIDWLIRCCEKEHEELCNDKYGHQDIVSDLKKDCRKKWDWLESLKNKVAPQTRWKPSEEQLHTLEKATHIVGSKYKSCLASLYQDLKKLK